MDVTCVPLSFLVSPYAKISFRLSISPQLHPLTLTLGNSGKGGEHVRVWVSPHIPYFPTSTYKIYHPCQSTERLSICRTMTLTLNPIFSSRNVVQPEGTRYT